MASQSTTPLTAQIKSLCDDSSSIQNHLCSVLSKDTFDNIVVSDMCGSGNTKVKKDYLAKNLIHLLTSIEDINKSLNPVFNCNILSKSLNNICDPDIIVDCNQFESEDITSKINNNSATLNSINTQLKTLSNAIESFRIHPQKPLSSSDTLLGKTDTLIEATVNTVSHDFKCFDENVENFISTDISKSIMDFLSEEDFRSEGGHGVVTYGAKYNYMGHKAQPKPLPGCLKSLMDLLNHTKTHGKYELNACLVNKYEGPESKLPEHSDDEYSINPTSDIFTISLGDARTVKFRDIISDNEIEHIPQHNSLYVMSRESQNYYQHRIDTDSTFTGIRYSLTFRSVHWRYLNSTCIIGDSNTKGMKFGSGKGTIGDSTPGKQVYAPRVEHINPSCCASYSNVVISVGLNSLRDREVSMQDVKDVYSVYKGKISEIQKLNKHCKIFVVPVLPTKLPIVNRKIIYFNDILLNDLLQSFESVSIVGGSARFVDRENGLLSESLSRYHADPLHLNSAGVGMLVRLIKYAIFQRKKSNKTHSNKPYSSAVSRRPP